MTIKIAKTTLTTLKWATTLGGLFAFMHGVISLALTPASKIGLWGLPEIAWAGGSICSGLACLVIAYFVYWRR